MSKIKSAMWFITLCLFSILVAMVIYRLTGEVNEQGEHSFLQNYRYHLMTFRFISYGLLIGLWPFLIKHFASKYDWPEEHILNMKQLRWKMVFWIIVIELVLVQDLIIKVFTWVF